jgi:hypothetical protein
MAKKLRWTDVHDIAIELEEARPDIDVVNLRFTDSEVGAGKRFETIEQVQREDPRGHRGRWIEERGSETSHQPRSNTLTEKSRASAGLRRRCSSRVPAAVPRDLARPWIDPVCLWGLKRALPASRAWAAAGASSTSLVGFARQLGLFGLPPRLRTKLNTTHRLRLLSKAAQTRWAEMAFEGADGDLAAVERERRQTAQLIWPTASAT